MASIADHAGDSPAVIVADGPTITYGELFERSQRVAALLREAGLRRGDGVALVLPNRPEFFEITWGCQLSGLYYSAVNTHFTPDEVAYVIDDSEAKAVFIDASMVELGKRILAANGGVDVHVVVGGALSTRVITLAEGGLKAMAMARVKVAALVLLGAVAGFCCVLRISRRTRNVLFAPAALACAIFVNAKILEFLFGSTTDFFHRGTSIGYGRD